MPSLGPDRHPVPAPESLEGDVVSDSGGTSVYPEEARLLNALRRVRAQNPARWRALLLELEFAAAERKNRYWEATASPSKRR